MMNDSLIHKDAVLKSLRERAPRSMHLAEVCVTMGLPKQERDRVLSVLEDLVSLGLAKEMPGRRFRAAPPAEPRVQRAPRIRGAETGTSGRLTMHPSGFGFVTAEDGGPDVFIPPPMVGAALHGDRVRILTRPSAKGREGAVQEVLERQAQRVGGVLRRGGGNVWIDPDDPRMRGPMPVVGQVPENADPGMQVVAEIIRHPRHADEVPEVKVVGVLGMAGVASVEVAKLKLRDGIVEEFPDNVLREAEEFPERVSPTDKKDREDLRGIDLVTIDPDDARDHDDALWGERTPDGGYRILIAIADVSHYVREGTSIDAEAIHRGCSIYLPDRAIPMLPPELSSNLASLVPNKDRLAMAVEVELGPTGGIRGHRLMEAVMRSGGRLTYAGVARALSLSEEAPRQREAEQRVDMLQALLDASRVLRARRIRRGSLDFDLPEGRVLLDNEGEPVDVYRSRKDPGIRQAYRLVEEMMLLANEVVATELHRIKVPAIYRVHGKPDVDKVERFVELAEAMGHQLDPEAALNPKTLSQFLRKTEDSPSAQSLSYLLLRAMKQATYDTTNVGHFALAAKYYLHFTSPIRRYPDLAVHRVVRSVIRNERFEHTDLRKHLRAVAVESSRLERRAIGLERNVVDLYRAMLMRDRVGEEFDATITGVAEHGFYAAFDEPFVEALTPVDRLSDFYEMDNLGIQLVGKRSGTVYALGDRIKLRLENVSIERRSLLAVPADQPTETAEGQRPEPEARKGRNLRRGSGRSSASPRNQKKGATPRTKSRSQKKTTPRKRRKGR